MGQQIKLKGCFFQVTFVSKVIEDLKPDVHNFQLVCKHNNQYKTLLIVKAIATTTHWQSPNSFLVFTFTLGQSYSIFLSLQGEGLEITVYY